MRSAPHTAPKLTAVSLIVCRFEEPRPGDDDAYVLGKRTFTLCGNLWSLNGVFGNLNEIPGGPNATMRKPIAEHVKNVLRGREPWGLKHRLTKDWAQLAAGKLELKAKVAMRKKDGAKRARAGPLEPGDEPPAKGPLFGDD